jgi:hypothetical protein
VQDEAFERLPALRHDQEPDGGPLRDECLLDGSPAGDQLLPGAEEVRVGRWWGTEGARRVRNAARPGCTRATGGAIPPRRAIGRATTLSGGPIVRRTEGPLTFRR